VEARHSRFGNVKKMTAKRDTGSWRAKGTAKGVNKTPKKQTEVQNETAKKKSYPGSVTNPKERMPIGRNSK